MLYGWICSCCYKYTFETKKKEVFIRDKISAAIVVDYTQQICAQIEAGLIGVMKRTQQPILNFMSLFGIVELSKNIGIQLN